MQPTNNRIIALQNVTFTCTARGFEVKYEWRRHNSSDIIGRWSNLTITRATPPDEDQYYCIAMTEGGYVFSDNVTLSVDGEDLVNYVFMHTDIYTMCNKIMKFLMYSYSTNNHCTTHEYECCCSTRSNVYL